MDNRSITHTRWNCTYHIVFIPKYRRKIMSGETKRDLVEIINKLCEMKQIELLDGSVCVDHIHMYVAIPPKISVSEFMSYFLSVNFIKQDLTSNEREGKEKNVFWYKAYCCSS